MEYGYDLNNERGMMLHLLSRHFIQTKISIPNYRKICETVIILRS